MRTQKGFIRNTAVMFSAMFISKALGAVLKIPLGNILGGEGMGYFTTAYSIFMPVLSFACAGIPTILTRNVAGYAARGEYGDIFAARRCSLLLAALLGTAGAALIYIIALPFVGFIANSPASLPGVLIIAPATLFCSVTAVYRGYYEGLSDTLPTAMTQIIESFVKALLGVGLSYIVYANGESLFGSQQAALPYSAAAAILGVTVSEMCGMVYMLFRIRRREDNFSEYGRNIPKKQLFTMCKEIIFASLPISLGASAANLLSFADMITVSNCVDLSVKLFGGYWGIDGNLSAIRDITAGPGNFMYGCYAGMIMSVYMLAAAASGVIGRCEMPRLAYAAEKGMRNETTHEIKLLIKGTAVITAPLTAIMAVLAEPILRILYPVRELEVTVSVVPLVILCAGGISAALLGAVCIVFHAYGDFTFPIKVTLIGGVLKLMFNVVFIIFPVLNIAGAAISAVLSNTICLIYAVKSVKRTHNAEINCLMYSLPSVFGALGGGTGAYLFYNGLSPRLGMIPAVLLSTVLGGIMYALMLYIYDNNDCVEVIKALRHRKA